MAEGADVTKDIKLICSLVQQTEGVTYIKPKRGMFLLFGGYPEPRYQYIKATPIIHFLFKGVEVALFSHYGIKEFSYYDVAFIDIKSGVNIIPLIDRRKGTLTMFESITKYELEMDTLRSKFFIPMFSNILSLQILNQ